MNGCDPPCGYIYIYMGLEHVGRLTARVVKRRLSSFWDHLRKARVCSILHPPPSARYRGCRNYVPPSPPSGYQRFPLSKPVVGRDVALHGVPALLGGLLSYLVSAFTAHSTSFSIYFFTRSSTVECVLNSESQFSLVVDRHGGLVVKASAA